MVQKYSTRTILPVAERRTRIRRDRLDCDTAGFRLTVQCVTHEHLVAGVDELLGSRQASKTSSQSASDTPALSAVTPAGRPEQAGADVSTTTSPAQHASEPPRSSPASSTPRSRLRTISTFSCDIAYSDSPTASRAFLGSRYSRTRITLPLLNSTIQAIADSVMAPLSLPRPRR